jgi:hypothetical protein
LACPPRQRLDPDNNSISISISSSSSSSNNNNKSNGDSSASQPDTVMGIDAYLLWSQEDAADPDAWIDKYCGYTGADGYLREAYRGGPYATKVLLAEAFDPENDGSVSIPAEVLRARLPRVLAMVREKNAAHGSSAVDAAIQEYIDFVELAERVQAETNEPVWIYVSY